jgi:two-component system, NarL family, sensor histidine kinase UhpB
LNYVGLKAALKELCEHISTQYGIDVVRELEDGPELSQKAQLCLYRVAQEALSNVAKHSQAHHAYVRFTVDQSSARLEVQDSGIGFNPATPTEGLGVASMRERLRIVGGQLEVRSNPGKGTRMAVVPYGQDDACSCAA